MKRSGILSGVLHILLHMAEADGPVTSETLAKMMRTNPVVVRRTLAGLREAGFVTSEKGHRGGWQLACDLNAVSLYDIYVALGSPALLAIGNRSQSPGCLVEEAVNAVMNQAFGEAEALLLARFGEVTLAELARTMRARRQARDAGRAHLDARAPGRKADGESDIFCNYLGEK